MFILSKILGSSKRSILSLMSVTVLISLGSISVKNPCCCNAGQFTPSLKSESIAVKYGNPSSESTMAVSNDGITACKTEYNVLNPNCACFNSENCSSLGTYTFEDLLSDRKSVYSIVQVNYDHFAKQYQKFQLC